MVPGPPKRRQTAGDHYGLVEDRARRFLEPPREPPHRVPLAARAVVEGDQGGELERLAQIKRAGFAGLELGDDEVAALQRPPECCSRVSVVHQGFSRPGAGQRRA
jgi:hypothetical protein